MAAVHCRHFMAEGGAPGDGRYQGMKAAWRFDIVALQPRLIRPNFQGIWP